MQGQFSGAKRIPNCQTNLKQFSRNTGKLTGRKRKRGKCLPTSTTGEVSLRCGEDWRDCQDSRFYVVRRMNHVPSSRTSADGPLHITTFSEASDSVARSFGLVLWTVSGSQRVILRSSSSERARTQSCESVQSGAFRHRLADRGLSRSTRDNGEMHRCIRDFDRRSEDTVKQESSVSV